MVHWERPDDVLFPQKWLEFNAKDCDSDNTVKYTLQDLPENRYDEAIKLMVEIFLREASFVASLSK